MLNFDEDLLQFIWQHRLLKPAVLHAQSGKEITVLKPGELNNNAGPDFFNASIRTDGIVLSGNIEVHIKTSDWLKHGHSKNRDYDNIILHVVYEHDADVEQNLANHVDVLELKKYITSETLTRYSQLRESKAALPCSAQLQAVNSLKFIAWLERMAIERLESKVKRISDWLMAFNNDYSQTFYTLLLRNFGFNVNSGPFEMLAKELPLSLLLKHSDNLFQLEALLLGCSGLLEDYFEDGYIKSLQNEFTYLQQKYKLVALRKELFKFSRMRPANFPTVRLAQLAALVHKQSRLLQSPHLITTAPELKIMLQVSPGDYWKKRFRPDGATINHDISLGEQAAENILINTFAPFFFFYGQKTGKPEFTDAALKLLENCRFETNAKTKMYAVRKNDLKTAADSQALITLHDNYCKPRRCLSCGIAAALLKPGANS